MDSSHWQPLGAPIPDDARDWKKPASSLMCVLVPDFATVHRPSTTIFNQ